MQWIFFAFLYQTNVKGVICTDKKAYKSYTDKRARKSNLFKDCVWAFAVGGLICCIGQGIGDLYKYLGADEENVKTLIPVTLVFIAVILTGTGVFDKIAKHAGAGTLVPITGFANAVASPAIDNKSEGYVMGVGAKMFVVAGPVIVYGTVTSVICGLIEVIVKWML
ncbi:MAG: stage V sporulation protein AC [Ruminococcaceae bacterium]|nr:stage V sporulation protein AC [Oscillospiraceae bacterium]